MFTARYLDLFTNYISLYNTCMKVDLRPRPCGRVPGQGSERERQRGWGRSSGLREEGLFICLLLGLSMED